MSEKMDKKGEQALLQYGELIKNQKAEEKELRRLQKLKQALELQTQQAITKEELTRLNEEIRKQDEAIARQEEDKNAAQEARNARQKEFEKEWAKERAEAEAKKQAQKEKDWDNFVKGGLKDSLASYATDIALKFKTDLDNTMSEFLSKQEAIAYNLNGSGRTFESVTKNLNAALAGTGIVKQEKVYEKLNELVQSGISYNAEQNAYLNALSSDLGMIFNASTGSLTRLFALQKTDLSSNRMAIEASLKTFLNQNYQTSVYIKEGFQSVSDSLIEAQSLMGSSAAVNLEASIQKWMGSLASSGMSNDSVQKLAAAIGQLGSGNISSLSGDNINKLLVMGAQRSGVGYTNLLTNGITASNADALMSGIVNYVASLGAGQNNVVKSALAKVFGLNVSDIVAAQNLIKSSATLTGAVTTNINAALLGNMSSLVHASTRLDNMLANTEYQWASDFAAHEGLYTAYKIASTVADAAGTVMAAGGEKGKILGTVTKLAPLLLTMGSLFTTMKNIGTNGLNNNAYGIFTALGSGGANSGYVSGNLSGLGSSSGSSTSGAYVLDTSDATKQARNISSEAAQEVMTQEELAERTTTDIYNLLELINTSVAGVSAIGESTSLIASNTVVIGEDDTRKMRTSVIEASMTLNNIYDLLSAKFGTTVSQIKSDNNTAINQTGKQYAI